MRVHHIAISIAAIAIVIFSTFFLFSTNNDARQFSLYGNWAAENKKCSETDVRITINKKTIHAAVSTKKNTVTLRGELAKIKTITHNGNEIIISFLRENDFWKFEIINNNKIMLIDYNQKKETAAERKFNFNMFKLNRC
ncbi:MAG: hypothetical protein COC00_001365 [Rhizobiales bacterium]|nr:hypothetical protein [Hyphomicrobiales bacterium]